MREAKADVAPPRAARVRRYVAAVALAGVGTLGVAGLALARDGLVSGEVWIAAGFAVGVFLLQREAFVFRWRGHQIAVSLEEVVVYAALATLPAGYLPLVVGFSSLVVQVVAGRELAKAAFNVGAFTFGSGAAAAVTGGLAGQLAIPAAAAALAGVFAYSLLVNGLLAGTLARLEGSSFRVAFGERFALKSLLQPALGGSGGLAALALWNLHPVALGALLPVVLFTRRYFALSARMDKELMVRRRLGSLVQELVGSPDVDRVADRVLQVCGDLLPAGRVVLTLESAEGAPDRVWARSFKSGLDASRPPIEAPLPGRGGNPLGWIRVHPWRRTNEGFDEPDRALLAVVAGKAAALLESARMYERERAARRSAEEAVRAREESLEALIESEQRYRSLFEGVPVGVYRTSPEGRILDANPAFARILGYERAEETHGVDAHDFYLAAPDRQRLTALIDSEGVVRDLETRLRRRDGALIWVKDTARAVRAPDGRTLWYDGVIEDVTGRKRAEEEARLARQQVSQSEKLSALGSLVSGVAHEVRTPLTYVANSLYGVRERLSRPGPEDVDALRAEVLRRNDAALEGVERLTRLVGELRRFSRVAAEERARESLNGVVAEAVSLFGGSRDRPVHVESDLKPTPAISMDRVQIQQVVINLLENAADVTSAGGVIRVATRPAAGGGEIVVSDEGEGIPPDVQRRLFDPFHTTKPHGTGLGLSIVRRIVEAHSGRIRFETAKGAGTVFTVFLPG